MKSLEVFVKKMHQVIPKVVVERAKQTHTSIIIWDPLKKQVREIKPDEIDQYLKEQKIIL